MAIEFELKYRATPEQQEAILREVTGTVHTISMETTYYDTPDKTLAARRITLRRRMENGVSVCTVKTPGGSAGRGEWELECGDIKEAILELCKLGAPEYVLLLTAGGIAPICGARFSRRAAMIETADFTAELALDSGVLTGGNRETPLCEVELELKSGSRDAMVAYAAVFFARYGLEPERRSKFNRAKSLAEGE